jgi:hypothetical protein
MLFLLYPTVGGSGMESAPDLLYIFVQALTLFADTLNHWFHIPWPLPVTVLLVPIVAILDIFVWSLRGRVFRLYCGYYPTVERKRCLNKVFGEWSKCREHNKERTRKTDNHRIIPKQRRWESQVEGQGVALDVQGRGFLSMRSHRDTLLYCQGFARWPEDVRNAQVLADYKRRFVNRWSQLKSLGIREFFNLIDHSTRQIVTSDDLPIVIRATRLTIMLATLGLVLVGISILVPSLASVIFEYCATFSFIIALATSRSGIGTADREWLSQSLKDAGKGIVGLTSIAVLTGLIGLYAHDVVDVLKTIVQTIFSVTVLVVVVYLLYRYSSKDKTKASKRKRAPRKRRSRRRKPLF